MKTMKNYKVTITETSKMDVYVEAESQLEAEKIIQDKWCNGEYILDADYFDGAEFSAVEAEEEGDARVTMSYRELSNLFCDINDNELPHIVGYIVFTADSFNKEYNKTSRTYIVSSDNKAYQSGMGGYSIYASCLDGTDPCLRLEGYMRGENAWKVEYCYVMKSDYDMYLKEKGEK